MAGPRPAFSRKVTAFRDVWRWTIDADEAFRQIVDRGGRTAEAMAAFRRLLGESDLMAYLAMMAPRLVELHRVLAPTGSMYLHCDPITSHYLKVLMDALFGVESCRRELIWRSGWVSGFKTRTANWVRNHDVLLYYVKTPGRFTFNKEHAYRAHGEGYERRGGGGNPRGVALDDVWDETALYSPWIKSFSAEKLGFMTQKPLALLERIIRVSSREGDLVLDPFCGSGTTLHAAESLGRSWIGIDRSLPAIELTRRRLRTAFGKRARFQMKRLSRLHDDSLQAGTSRVPRATVPLATASRATASRATVSGATPSGPPSRRAGARRRGKRAC